MGIPLRPLTDMQKLSIVIAQFIVIIPHLSHLPILLSIVSGAVLFYLFVIYKNKKTLSKYIKSYQVIVVILGLFSILFSYKTLLGIDAGAAFLVLCLLGKLLELKKRRDAYIALTLSLFVVSSSFLFSQTIVYTALALLGIVAIFWAMIAQNLNEDLTTEPIQQTPVLPDSIAFRKNLLGLLSRLLLQAVPLLIVLFVFFPRIPPLWSIPISSSQNKTGISDEMSPGDFASLSQSSELAFRVLDKKNNLTQHLPDKNQLYWRGMVLSHFNGITWSLLKDQRIDATVWRSLPYAPAWFSKNFTGKLTIGFEYKVLLQPTQQYWLFALDTPYSQTKNTGITREYNLRSAQEINQQFSYDAVQLTHLRKDAELPDWLRQANLELPAGGNPQTQQMAQQVFHNLGNDPERYINFWLKWIRQQNFVYTLQPPRLSGNRIDQFLFQSRRGFCEHYASAYTFLMRAAGIPARVVVGYQGGQYSPDRQSWEVRQMDAHAWVEVWLPKQGWLRVDPTAAIAPERIEQGMNSLMQKDQQLFGDDALSQLKYSQFKWLGKARVWSDYASYIWQRDVVGFDQTQQQSFLERLFGIKSLYSQVLWMTALIVSTILLVISVLWWKRRKVWHPLDAPLQQLSKKLARQHPTQHFARLEHEGVIDWLNRLSENESFKRSAQQLIQLYQQARYSSTDSPEKRLLSQMRAIVRKWPRSPSF